MSPSSKYTFDSHGRDERICQSRPVFGRAASLLASKAPGVRRQLGSDARDIERKVSPAAFAHAHEECSLLRSHSLVADLRPMDPVGTELSG